MIVEKLNAGFVYKIVQFENSNGDIIKPEKKSNDKKNYAGLKYMKYNEETDTLEVIMDTPRFGYNKIDKVKPTTKVEFIQI